MAVPLLREFDIGGLCLICRFMLLHLEMICSHVGFVQVKLLTENTSEAIKDFEKSVELNPTFPIAYVQKLYTEYRAATEAQDQG